MAITVSVLLGGANSHQTTAEEVNYTATDILGAGVVGTLTNTSGVAPATGGFAVNAQGTPDMTVAVSAGVCYATATPTSGNSQLLRAKNSASSNVTISANSTGGTRYDWVYVKIDPDKAKDPNSGASDVATLVTSRSTSNVSDNGTPPTYGTNIAVVTVANGASSITNGNITDKRANPTIALGTNSITANQLATSAITLGSSSITSNSTTTSATAAVPSVPLTVTVTIPAGGRKVKISIFARDVFASTTTVFQSSIWDGTVGSGTQLTAALFNVTASSSITVPLAMQAIVTPSAGTKTYSLGLLTGGGTATVEAGATYPAFILVEAI